MLIGPVRSACSMSVGVLICPVRSACSMSVDALIGPVPFRFTSENDQDVVLLIFRSTHLYARKLIVMDDNLPGSSKKLVG